MIQGIPWICFIHNRRRKDSICASVRVSGPDDRTAGSSLEEAWKQYADHVDVIALSVEETDTHEKLKEFAAEYGLSFHIGRDKSGMFYSMDGTAIPTTLIVDQDRRVVAVEIGAKISVEDFTSLFDSLLNANATK